MLTTLSLLWRRSHFRFSPLTEPLIGKQVAGLGFNTTQTALIKTALLLLLSSFILAKLATTLWLSYIRYR